MSNIEVAEFIRKKIASNIKPPLVSLEPRSLQYSIKYTVL